MVENRASLFRRIMYHSRRTISFSELLLSAKYREIGNGCRYTFGFSGSHRRGKNINMSPVYGFLFFVK